MFVNLRGIFAHHHAGTSKPPFDAAAFEQDMTARLDTGQVSGEDVVQSLTGMSPRDLDKIDVMVRARMMGVLSDEIDVLNDAARNQVFGRGGKLRQVQTLTQAGQFMAVHTQVPDDIVEGLHDLGDTVIADIELQNEQDQEKGVKPMDGTTPIGLKDAREVLGYFNRCIAERFKLQKGLTTIVVDNPRLRRYGQARFNNHTERHELETNIASIKTVRDIPLAAATSLHEGMHAVVTDGQMRFEGNEEAWRQKDPGFYILMRLCSRNFYTSKDPLYRSMPEEVLAERVGIRFAMHLSNAMNCRIPRDTFMDTVASTISHPSVFQEVERNWQEIAFVEVPPDPWSRQTPQAAAPTPPQDASLLSRIKHVAGVLRANF